MHIYLGSFWDGFLTPYFYANSRCQEPGVRFFKASVICVAKDATPIFHAESMIGKFVSPWDSSYEIVIVLFISHASGVFQ